MDWQLFFTLLNSSGLAVIIGGAVKYLFETRRQAKKDRVEAANLGVQTDINLDQARLVGIKGLMDQIQFDQTVIKELRLENDLLRQQNVMLRQILADHDIPVIIENKGKVSKDGFIE